MPIEIRELYIKAVIDSGGDKSNLTKTGVADGAQGTGAGTPGGDLQQVIDLCVEKVLEIIKEKKER